MNEIKKKFLNRLYCLLITSKRPEKMLQRNTSSVREMLDELEWPSLEARRDQSSLLLFHKIHSGAVSIEKDGLQSKRPQVKTSPSQNVPELVKTSPKIGQNVPMLKIVGQNVPKMIFYSKFYESLGIIWDV